MNNIDKQYQDLLKSILDYGVEKKDRTGTGTKSIFGYTIRHKMSDGFPLLTTKKMVWKTMVTELLWFLRGDTNIKYLVDNDCHIWDGDAFKNFMTKSEGDPDMIWNQDQFIRLIKTDDEFAKKWGELGPIYGKQWRNWAHGKEQFKDDEGKFWLKFEHYDQIKDLIQQLKHNPDSRRLMVSSWNVGELDQMVLPPCHYGFQVYTRELSLEERARLTINTPEYRNYTEEQWKEYIETTSVPKRAISLMFNMRSTDVGLGLGFNLASYGLLLMMIAKQVNMVPDELVYNGGDVHLYLNHTEPIKEQLTREPYELPIVKLSDRVVNDISEYTLHDIELEGYQSHPTIKLPLSN